jgi:deazaflavin-dependent oxidoreductase (nitroreductase family)
MRTRHERDAPFPRALARLNRRVANPVMRLLAGWLPPLAIVRHRGRVTGRAYATPVIAFGRGNDLVIGVLYGTSSDWVSNLRTARRATITRLGRTCEYEQPQIVGTADVLRLLPAMVRSAFRPLGVRHFVHLTASGPAGSPT